MCDFIAAAAYCCCYSCRARVNVLNQIFYDFKLNVYVVLLWKINKLSIWYNKHVCVAVVCVCVSLYKQTKRL